MLSFSQVTRAMHDGEDAEVAFPEQVDDAIVAAESRVCGRDDEDALLDALDAELDRERDGDTPPPPV